MSLKIYHQQTSSGLQMFVRFDSSVLKALFRVERPAGDGKNGLAGPAKKIGKQRKSEEESDDEDDYYNP